jgi:hypothetical protein
MEEDNNIVAKTAFDAATQNHQLEIIKAAIPYINVSEQRLISVFVKFSELRDTISIFQKPESSIGICSLGTNKGSTLDMLNDIKSVCTNAEKERINLIINFMDATRLYSSYRETYGDERNPNQPNTSNLFESLKKLLTPEQQKMFDTYSLMLNTMQ